MVESFIVYWLGADVAMLLTVVLTTVLAVAAVVGMAAWASKRS